MRTQKKHKEENLREREREREVYIYVLIGALMVFRSITTIFAVLVLRL